VYKYNSPNHLDVQNKCDESYTLQKLRSITLHKEDTCCSKSSMVTSSQQIIRDLRLMVR